MHCTQCGVNLPELAAFCPRCGTRVPDSQGEKSSNKPEQISNIAVQLTVHKPQGFRILLYLAILFGGVISADLAISRVFGLPAETAYKLTKMSLDVTIAVAVIGMAFARRRVTWKTTLIATGMLSLGILCSVLSSRNRSGAHLWSQRASDNSSSSEAQPAEQEIQIVPDLFVDDIGDKDAGAVFENTFAFDATCDGLRLMRWTTTTDEERTAMFQLPHWWIDFAGRRYNLQMKYVLGMMLSPGKSAPSDSLAAMKRPGFHLDGDTAQQAVHEACLVAKQRYTTWR